MDCTKTGEIIRRLRIEHKFTQKQLAEKLTVSDKAVSKWERGMGCPDISLLGDLSDILDVDLTQLLSGEIETNEKENGKMKNLKFFICPICGNVITAVNDAAISCCGMKLNGLTPEKSENDDKLSVEKIENDYFISSSHEMTKEHYISFVALLTGDTIMMRRQYPEWNLQTRIPCFGHGKLVWFCTNHGLKYQLI